MKDSGSYDLAKKDSGTKDVGPKAIDFGNGKASAPPKDYSGRGRPDSEKCYSEYATFNSGANPSGLGMNISSKDNGGERPGSGEGGM